MIVLSASTSSYPTLASDSKQGLIKGRRTGDEESYYYNQYDKGSSDSNSSYAGSSSDDNESTSSDRTSIFEPGDMCYHELP